MFNITAADYTLYYCTIWKLDELNWEKPSNYQPTSRANYNNFSLGKEKTADIFLIQSQLIEVITTEIF